MNKLYITGGRQRKTVFNAIAEEWRLYEAALILRIDVDKETHELCVPVSYTHLDVYKRQR